MHPADACRRPYSNAAGPPWIIGLTPTEHVQALAVGAGGHPGVGADLLAPVLPTIVPAEQHIVATDLLELYVAAGRLKEAEPLVAAGAVDAALRLARGDAAGAAEQARRAAARAAGALQRERWSLLAGQALAACGEQAAARETLIAVEARCASLGAERLRSIATRELRRLGHRVRRGQPPHHARPGALSTREAEIARLIAQGLTNREVAEQLVLSVKTVETHVRNVFAKLGIASRVELAVLIYRADT